MSQPADGRSWAGVRRIGSRADALHGKQLFQGAWKKRPVIATVPACMIRPAVAERMGRAYRMRVPGFAAASVGIHSEEGL
jgi:hypothetical protein